MSQIEESIVDEMPEVSQDRCGPHRFAKIDLEIPKPPQPTGGESATKVIELIRAAQQVLFLPQFDTTDHLVYGQDIGSGDVKKGLPTIRTASITGTNFILSIHLNYNWDQLYFHIYYRNSRDFLYVENGVTDETTASWLIAEVLEPVRDEMIIDGDQAISRHVFGESY